MSEKTIFYIFFSTIGLNIFNVIDLII